MSVYKYSLSQQEQQEGIWEPQQNLHPAAELRFLQVSVLPVCNEQGAHSEKDRPDFPARVIVK